MNILLWILFGSLVGWLGSLILSGITREQGTRLVAYGAVGGVVGGFIVNIAGHATFNDFNIYSVMAAVVSAMIVVWAYKYSPCFRK